MPLLSPKSRREAKTTLILWGKTRTAQLLKLAAKLRHSRYFKKAGVTEDVYQNTA